MTLKFKLAIILAFALLFIGCKNEMDPSQMVTMPISICLPTNEVIAAQHAPALRRTIGDPGTSETFLLPNYIYFIVMKEENGVWSCWQTIEEQATDSKWQKKRYTGSLQTTGDSIYMFTEEFDLMLNNGQFNGKVFAVASAVPLTFNKSPLSSISNLNDVLTLTFDASTATVQQNLQHIYTSPYNYEVSGDYYGAFSSITQRVPRVNLMLYHVASKVDLKWNVADTSRIKSDPAQAVRLTYMEAQRLYNGQAYCFMPMRNTLPAIPASGGYNIPIISSATDEGQWWEGRSYFYTIPYTVDNAPDYFPLQLQMKTNGNTGSGYELVLKQTFDTTDVFVPWLRGNFVFHNPLENKQDTIITN